jgi:hypothetical protein
MGSFSIAECLSDAMFINLGFHADMLVLSAGPHTYKQHLRPDKFRTEIESVQTASSLPEWSVIDGESELGLSMLRLMDAGFFSIGDNDILARLPDELIDDWKAIIVNLIKRTFYADEDFRQFLSRHMVSLGEKNRHDEQQAKEATSRKKAVATKALLKPGPKHKLAGYRKAFKKFGGKPERGAGEAVERFWKKVIDYADEARLYDDDIDEEPVNWGVTWKTARNQIGKLLKE